MSEGVGRFGLSSWLFGGLERLGRLGASALGKGQVARVSASVENANLIDLKGEGGAFGHGYFHDNPAVSSDLIQVIRHGRKPGKKNGRPLKKLRKGYWVITDDYLLSPKKAGAGP